MGLVDVKLDAKFAELFKPGQALELVMRDSKGRYLSFVKSVVAASTSEDSKDIANKVLNAVKENALNVKNLKVDMNCIKELNCLNVGLEAANLAVDVAGFVMIANKLDGLTDLVNGLSVEVGKLHDIADGNIGEQFDTFKMKYIEFSRKIEDGDNVDDDRLSDTIDKMHAFIKKLLGFYGEYIVNKENLLNIISTLLPAYSHLLQWRMINYFYDKGKSIDTEPYIDIFKLIISDDFKEATLDYFFNEKHLHNLEAMVATNDVIAIDGYSYLETIKDEEIKLNCLKTKENYAAYNEYVQEILTNKYEKEAKEVSTN
jgi:hypothetical protein